MMIETFNKLDVWQVRVYNLLKYIIKLNISGNDKRNLFNNKIKACLIGYCYHLVIVIIRLLLSLGYCYHSVLVIIQLLLSFGSCYHSVIVIRCCLAQCDHTKWDLLFNESI
jgi:hypothetical protein